MADLEAMQDKPPGVQVVQLCFEDLIHKPRSTLKSLYASIPGFAGWPLSDPHTLLPPETKLYGETHIKDWFEEKEVNLAGGKGGDWGGTKRSYDRYSSGKERSDHVNVWKEVPYHRTTPHATHAYHVIPEEAPNAQGCRIYLPNASTLNPKH